MTGVIAIGLTVAACYGVWRLVRHYQSIESQPLRLEDMPRHPERVRNYPGTEDAWLDLALQLAIETSEYDTGEAP